MTLVSPSQSNPGEEINASDINGPVNQLASTINGGLDDTNINYLSGSKLTAGTLPVAAFDTNTNPETRMSEGSGDYVASGCLWTQSSGLVGTMSAGVVYTSGKRNVISAIASRTFTASKDTYVSVSSTGVIGYQEVANNSSSPSLATGSMWLAIVVTNASAITHVNTGQVGATAPVVTFRTLMVSDTNGNLIYPRARQRILSVAQVTSAHNTGAVTTAVDITGAYIAVNIPSTGARIKLTAFCNGVTNASGTGTNTSFLIREGSTTIGYTNISLPNGTLASPGVPIAIITATPGTHTYKLTTQNTVATNVAYGAGATGPIQLLAELE